MLGYTTENGQGKGRSGLCMLYPLPFPQPVPEATAVFVYRDTQFQELIGSFMGEGSGTLMMFDEFLSPVYQLSFSESPALTDGELRQLTALKGTCVHILSIQGTEYVVVRTLSENSGMTYLYMEPREQFYAEILEEKRNFYLLIGGLLLCGVLLAVLLALYHYLPLGRIVRTLSPGQQPKNEYAVISTAIRRGEELKNTVSHQQPFVRSRCLQQILYGNRTEAELQENLQWAGMHFDYLGFVVVLLRFPPAFTQTRLAAELLMGVTEEGMNCYVTELDQSRSLAVLCNLPSDSDWRTMIERYLTDCCENLEEAVSCLPTIGVGSLHQGLTLCGTSYLEARTALEFLKTGDHQSYYDELSRQEDEQYPRLEQSLLMQSIRHGNLQATRAAAHDIVAAMQKNCPSVIIMRYVGAEVMGNLIRLAEQMEYPLDMKKLVIFPNELDYLGQFEQRFTEFSCALCGHVEEKKGARYRELKTAIVHYLTEHFCEYDISLEAVADHFEISTSYLSKMILEETGSRFNQYLTMLRMERAKELLTGSEMKVREIVEAVGYADTANFIRKFRNIEGMTPGQYREAGRQAPSHEEERE